MIKAGLAGRRLEGSPKRRFLDVVKNNKNLSFAREQDARDKDTSLR